MKISVFGASGFIGYSFIRDLLEQTPQSRPKAYSTNAGSLTNLSRHDLPIRLISYAQLPSLELDSSTEHFVNFSHPFAPREDFTVKEQISKLLQFFHHAMESNPKLRLIHVSSMSVYEPFANGREFGEASTIKPPRSDFYAKNKAQIDKEILSWRQFSNRIQILRPTVVYGPFGRPWTDNIIKQFLAGPVWHRGLKGKIQPIWVVDVARLIVESLNNFVPGVFNLPGPEIMTWKSFLSFFEGIVEAGSLSQDSGGLEEDSLRRSSLWNRSKIGFAKLIKQPYFKEIATPLWRRLPDSIREPIKQRLLSSVAGASAQSNLAASRPYCKEFFEEDRLVSIRKLQDEFPDFSLTSLSEVEPIMKSYFRFRFTNETFWRPSESG